MVAGSRGRELALAVGIITVAAVVSCGSDRPGFGDVGQPDGGGGDGGGSSSGFLPGGDAGSSEAGVVDKCTVPPDADNGGALECTVSSPPDSFAPVTKWTWKSTELLGGFVGSLSTPLVANLTDDNGDGKINLCDVPDVIVAIGGNPGKIVMLSGDKGQLEATFDGDILGWVNPALGDLDGDGIPEIVATDTQSHIVAYDNKGHKKWTSPEAMNQNGNGGMAQGCHAMAIYDLDGDGKAEILASYDVFSSTGQRLFGHTSTAPRWCQTTTAADLDGDGKLEVIFGNAAYHHDGTKYWDIGGPAAQPQVANLDADPEPEIFLAREDGLLVLEHNGVVKFGPVKPIAGADSQACWTKPAAIHDFDGDGIADISASTCNGYGVYNVTPTGLALKWQNSQVQDGSGSASNTAFDFLGRGIAQAIYGDEHSLWVFDGKTGAVAPGFPTARTSATIIEYPVVADVDNDGSADIVVVSFAFSPGDAAYKNTVEVLQDAQKRWIPTRRIWNQHAYHVTNVREDGTIPRVMKKSWQNLNTFRTNTQVSGGGDCKPPAPNAPK
ncbi:MAG: Hemolysin-related protein Vcp [Labilithrix sp.]|nr:Hemolysin-related protein Vcp [Labilithrix sp.]